MLGCCLPLGALFAQSADEKAVAESVETLRKALISADKSVLENLAADQLTYGHSSGVIEDKRMFVDALVSRRSVFTAVSFLDQDIRISGDVAIVRHRLVADTNNNNVPGKVDILILLVWQKQAGQWKLLARQAARIPPPPK
jgi:hypothetical protein